MNELNETLENALATLQLIANNGGIATLVDEEARAIVDELERLRGYERAYEACVRSRKALVLKIALKFDEQANLIAELLEQLKQTVDALAHWFPHWGDPKGANSQMMIDARGTIAAAERYLRRYRQHMK